MKRALKVVGGVLVGLLLLGVVLGALDDSPKARVRRPTIAMADGTKLAVDVILPDQDTGPVPVVLLQTRYWRSFSLRVPENVGHVPKGPREPIVEALVAQSGYASR